MRRENLSTAIGVVFRVVAGVGVGVGVALSPLVATAQTEIAQDQPAAEQILRQAQDLGLAPAQISKAILDGAFVPPLPDLTRAMADVLGDDCERVRDAINAHHVQVAEMIGLPTAQKEAAPCAVFASNYSPLTALAHQRWNETFGAPSDEQRFAYVKLIWVNFSDQPPTLGKPDWAKPEALLEDFRDDPEVRKGLDYAKDISAVGVLRHWTYSKNDEISGRFDRLRCAYLLDNPEIDTADRGACAAKGEVTSASSIVSFGYSWVALESDDEINRHRETLFDQLQRPDGKTFYTSFSGCRTLIDGEQSTNDREVFVWEEPQDGRTLSLWFTQRKVGLSASFTQINSGENTFDASQCGDVQNKGDARLGAVILSEGKAIAWRFNAVGRSCRIAYVSFGCEFVCGAYHEDGSRLFDVLTPEAQELGAIGSTSGCTVFAGSR